MKYFFTHHLSQFVRFLHRKGLTKAVLAVHGYLLVISVLVNSMMFLVLSGASLDQLYSGSVVNVPLDVQEQVVEGSSSNAEEMMGRVGDVEQVIGALEQSQRELQDQLHDALSRPPQTIVREVRVPVVETRTVVVHEAAPAAEPVARSVKSVPVAGHSGVQSASGEMVVKDSNCELGYALVNPRLQRRCAVDGDLR